MTVGYPELSLSTIWLWYLYPPYWLRSVLALLDLFLDSCPVVPDIRFRFLDGYTICPGRSFVARDTLERFCHVLCSVSFPTVPTFFVLPSFPRSSMVSPKSLTVSSGYAPAFLSVRHPYRTFEALVARSAVQPFTG